MDAAGQKSFREFVSNRSTALLKTAGKRVAKLRGQELLVRVDSERLIAWDIAPGGGEYQNRLVLVGIGSERTISLSGARTPEDHSSKRWEPVFARS